VSLAAADLDNTTQILAVCFRLELPNRHEKPGEIMYALLKMNLDVYNSAPVAVVKDQKRTAQIAGIELLVALCLRNNLLVKRMM
jgi:hypothetical protein